VGLELRPLSLGEIIEELLEWKVAAPVYKPEIKGRKDPLRWPRGNLPQKLAVTSRTSGGRLVGIVRFQTKSHGVVSKSTVFWDTFTVVSITKTTEFVLLL
jgi:hypothetical protein